MIRSAAAIIILLTGCILAPGARAQEVSNDATVLAPVSGDQRFEVTILAGGGHGVVKNSERTPTGFAEAVVRFGINLPKIGGGRRGSAFAIMAEAVPIATIDQQPRATGSGLNLMFRYQYAGERWRPMFLFGAGMMWTDEKVPPGEVKRNFTPQVGVGVQYMLGSNFGLDLEYRFWHLSNKHKTETNPGINAHSGFFGISWFF
jgi:opacity protein-like surface antigen